MLTLGTRCTTDCKRSGARIERSYDAAFKLAAVEGTKADSDKQGQTLASYRDIELGIFFLLFIYYIYYLLAMQ